MFLSTSQKDLGDDYFFLSSVDLVLKNEVGLAAATSKDKTTSQNTHLSATLPPALVSLQPNYKSYFFNLDKKSLLLLNLKTFSKFFLF